MENPDWKGILINNGMLEITLPNEIENHQLVFLPGAFTDIFGRSNHDTLEYKLKLESSEQFGTVSLSLNHLDSTQNYLISLHPTNQSEPVFQTSINNQSEKEILCDFLKPGQYLLQIAIDLNQNGRWDTGNYFKGLQAEPLLIREIPAIKANWEINFEVSLEK
jgi:hypothetical protein